MTAVPPAWSAALGAVQRREHVRRRRATLRGAALVLGGVTLLLALTRFTPLPGPTLSQALGAGLGGAAAWLAAQAWRARPFPPLSAAQLADRRAGLDGVLTTALTLPPALDALEQALHGRVRERADQAARTLPLAQVVPADPPRAWMVPAALLLAAAVAWTVPAPARVAVPAAAVVPAPDEQAATPAGTNPTAAPDASASGTSGAAPAEPGTPDIPVGQEPTDTPDAQATAQTGAARAGGTVTSGTGTLQGEADFSPQRLREARQAILPTDTALYQKSLRAAGRGGVNDSPFGSREGGRVSEQATPEDPRSLASAPYDPTTASGKSQQQKADQNSSGLRSASGGRGLESDGSQRCVDQCLTNNDMNRGGDRSRDAQKPPGEGTSAGTSDSGAQAAQSSSGTGLGVGQLRNVSTSYRASIASTAGVDADRVRVLVAPTATPAGASAPGSVSGAAWSPAPEDPLAPGSVPAGARDVVRAYFNRSTP